MMRGLKSEIQIAGGGLYIISAVLAAAFILFAMSAGDLLNVSGLGAEVVFPFFAAIAVGEWGKTRADDNYEVIAAQSRSVFRWAARRYIAVMGTVSLFAVAGLTAASLIRDEMTAGELLLAYFPTAFFLSSLSALIGASCRQEHTAALVCGTVWLAELMSSSLLRLPGAEYFYLFTRFAGDKNGVWPVSKAALTAMGAAMWPAVCRACRRRRG